MAVTLIIAFNLAAAESALDSWMKRRPTPRMTMRTMSQAPTKSLVSWAVEKLMVARTVNRMTSGLRTAWKQAGGPGMVFLAGDFVGTGLGEALLRHGPGQAFRGCFQLAQGFRGLHSARFRQERGDPAGGRFALGRRGRGVGLAVHSVKIGGGE